MGRGESGQSTMALLRRKLVSSDADRCIQGTNDDASVSKMSCINLGYFEDDFLRLFVRRRTKRPPIINRGYFARVQAIRQVIDCFVESTVNTEEGTKGGQILS